MFKEAMTVLAAATLLGLGVLHTGSEAVPETPVPTATATPTPAFREGPPIPSPTPVPDLDGDGAPDAGDCAPDHNGIYPGAPENLYTFENEDCDETTLNFADGDRDGFLNPVAGGNDCDDSHPALNLNCTVDLDGDGYWNPAMGGNDEDDSRPICAPTCPLPSQYIWPVYGGISTYFSYGHPAIDITAGCGTPIRAAASGTVVFAGWDDGYGNAVHINYDTGVPSLYAHLSAIWVGYGQYVTQGEGIGTVGSTGYSTGCHLHYGHFGSNPLNVLP